MIKYLTLSTALLKLNNEQIKPNMKLLFGLLSLFTKKGETKSTASDAFLAHELGLSTGYVNRLLKRMSETEPPMIVMTKEFGRRNIEIIGTDLIHKFENKGKNAK